MKSIPHVLVRAFKLSRWHTGLLIGELGGSINSDKHRHRKTWLQIFRRHSLHSKPIETSPNVEIARSTASC